MEKSYKAVNQNRINRINCLHKCLNLLISRTETFLTIRSDIEPHKINLSVILS